MSNMDQATRIAAQNVKKEHEAAQQSWSQIERNFSESLGYARNFRLKTLDTLRSNTEASLDLAEELLTAKSPEQVAAAWKNFADRQVEAINKHTSDLAAMTRNSTR
jgi:hypothetical protein